MVKRCNPKAGAEHGGSAAKPHAEMGGNNDSSIRPQDAINEFLLEMIPVKTELTERFEQQKEEEDQVRQARLRERTQSRAKSNASRKLVAEKAHHNTTLVKKNLVQSQDSQDRDHTKTMFTPDELAQQKEEEEAERWLAELETKPIKPDPGEQLDGAASSTNRLEEVETKVDPESISSNPVIARPVNENRSLYTVPDNSPREALDERASLAVQRAAARDKASRLDGSTQFREPVSLAEKLLRARLASTLEETHNTKRVEQTKESVVETEAKSKLDSAEPAVVAETIAAEAIVSESMVAERQTQGERDVDSEVLSPDIKCDATSQKLTKAETLAKPVEKPVVAVEPDALAVAPPAPPGNGVKSGRPEWSEKEFECLLFEVAGLMLAVPLISLGSIHTMAPELTSIVGRSRWFMGLMQTQDRSLRVVDTALWVMPERYQERYRDQYTYVIRLGNSEWSLACNRVDQAITLSPDDVKWRSERSKRPWLAGTVVDRMCALMDVATLEAMLERNEMPSS